MGNKCCGTNSALNCDQDYEYANSGAAGIYRRPGKTIRQSS